MLFLRLVQTAYGAFVSLWSIASYDADTSGLIFFLLAIGASQYMLEAGAGSLIVNAVSRSRFERKKKEVIFYYFKTYYLVISVIFFLFAVTLAYLTIDADKPPIVIIPVFFAMALNLSGQFKLHNIEGLGSVRNVYATRLKIYGAASLLGAGSLALGLGPWALFVYHLTIAIFFLQGWLFESGGQYRVLRRRYSGTRLEMLREGAQRFGPIQARYLASWGGGYFTWGLITAVAMKLGGASLSRDVGFVAFGINTAFGFSMIPLTVNVPKIGARFNTSHSAGMKRFTKFAGLATLAFLVALSGLYSIILINPAFISLHLSPTLLAGFLMISLVRWASNIVSVYVRLQLREVGGPLGLMLGVLGISFAYLFEPDFDHYLLFVTLPVLLIVGIYVAGTSIFLPQRSKDVH